MLTENLMIYTECLLPAASGVTITATLRSFVFILYLLIELFLFIALLIEFVSLLELIFPYSSNVLKNCFHITDLQ